MGSWRHLYGAFARAVRQVLVDHARGQDAVKRGGDREADAATERSSPENRAVPKKNAFT